jgi:hypothetical protein
VRARPDARRIFATVGRAHIKLQAVSGVEASSGVERSGAGIAEGEGVLRFGGDLRGIRVMTRAGAGGIPVPRHPAVTRQCRTLRPVSTLPN